MDGGYRILHMDLFRESARILAEKAAHKYHTPLPLNFDELLDLAKANLAPSNWQTHYAEFESEYDLLILLEEGTEIAIAGLEPCLIGYGATWIIEAFEDGIPEDTGLAIWAIVQLAFTELCVEFYHDHPINMKIALIKGATIVRP